MNEKVNKCSLRLSILLLDGRKQHLLPVPMHHPLITQLSLNMFSTYFVKRRPNHFERNLKDLSPNFFLLYLFNIFLDKITLKEMIMWSAFSLICLVYLGPVKMSTPHIVCVNCLEITRASECQNNLVGIICPSRPL